MGYDGIRMMECSLFCRRSSFTLKVVISVDLLVNAEEQTTKHLENEERSSDQTNVLNT